MSYSHLPPLTFPTFPEDPMELFHQWFQKATETELKDPNAMSLATATPDGIPSVRIVLLKGIQGEEFIFYTNLKSRKGDEISLNSHVSLCFHWKTIHRQIRIDGIAAPVTDAEANAYFRTRPKASQIGTWASHQSKPMHSRKELEESIAHFTTLFENKEVPRPPHWSGFHVTPQSIEFWEEQPFRLHHRVIYNRHKDGWEKTFLYP